MARDDDPQVDQPGSVGPVLTDYHLHLRPGRGRDGRGVLHPGERRALPRGRRGAAGSRSWGSPSTSTASRQALELWRHPYWQEQAEDDLDAYCEFVRTTPLRLGIEADFVRGAEDRIAEPARRRTSSTTWSARCTSSARRGPSTTAATTSGSRSGDPDALWRTYFEWQAEAARSGLFDIVSPSRPGQDLGRRPARARARSALPLRALDRGDRRVRDRRRGLDRRAAQAGRRDLPGPGVRGDVRRGRRRVRALLRRARAGSGRLRLRPGARVPRRTSAWSGSASSSDDGALDRAAAGDRLRRDRSRGRRADGAPGRHRLRQPPPRRGRAAGARRASRSSTTAASRGTPTPTCSPTR